MMELLAGFIIGILIGCLVIQIFKLNTVIQLLESIRHILLNPISEDEKAMLQKRATK